MNQNIFSEEDRFSADVENYTDLQESNFLFLKSVYSSIESYQYSLPTISKFRTDST